MLVKILTGCVLCSQDVFLMIRRGKVTIFTDAKETTPLMDVKRIVEGISKIPPENQRLFREEQVPLLTHFLSAFFFFFFLEQCTLYCQVADTESMCHGVKFKYFRLYNIKYPE